jgi:hypothetical protein
MTNGKFVNVGKPYKDLKSAEEFKHLSYFSQSMSPQARASRAARDLLNKESVELDEQALKAGKGKTTITVNFLDDASLAKKAEKKFNVNIKTTKNQGADVSGEKKDIIAYLLSNDYGMDAEDVRELFPELQEDSTVTERLKVSNMTEIAMTLKQLAAKYKDDIAKAQQSGNTDSLKKAKKELIAWAMDNNEIGNAKEADVWLDNVVADKDQFDALLKFAKN